MSRSYKLGSEFPREGFVQKSIEAFFVQRGFTLEPRKFAGIDLLCAHPTTGERWHVEAKGVTSQTGLDFRTCIGQLVIRMSDQSVRHAIAIPNDPSFSALIGQVSPWVVERLGLHWLIVDQGGAVKVVEPPHLQHAERSDTRNR